MGTKQDGVPTKKATGKPMTPGKLLNSKRGARSMLLKKGTSKKGQRTKGTTEGMSVQKPDADILTPKTSKTKQETATQDKATSKKSETSKQKKQAKNAAKYSFPNGEMIDGVNQYKVSSQIRKGTTALELDVYIVKDVEQGDEFRMKTSQQDLGMLKMEAALLRKLEKKPGEKCFLSMAEYGTVAKNKIEFLIVTPFGMTIYDVMKKVTNGPLTLDCAFSVGIQMLKAIKDLHSIGYLHRNIRPSAFTIGLGEEESAVFLQDFRAVRKYEENKKHVTARSTVKTFGTLRFCSRASQNQKDQGRRDDLESWLYTLFYMIDHDSLSWTKEENKETVASGKEAFMKGEGKNQFSKVPKSLAPAISVIFAYDFPTEPDYDTIRKVLTDYQNEKRMVLKACDWQGKPKLNELYGETNYSEDCKVTGERDAVVRGAAKKKKGPRKKLSAGDVIQCQGANSGWKVINLLGSGGFGDVYKVHRDGQPPTKCYALKTEGEDGEKRFLRLKVEVTVMMKTAEKRKEGKFEHFIEFVDRGKCEELKCKFVVMGLVGPSLEDIRRKYLLAAFSKHTAFNVAVQTVKAVKDLHSIGYLHRDIKPANYAVGLGETESTVYMLDFGIAKLYVDENGVHKTRRKKVKFLGTLRYASRACMLQIEQGRKDDLETWIYMVFDFVDESEGMPWRKLSDAKEILKSKQDFFASFDALKFSRLLRRLKELVLYIDSMQYETPPDYDYIIQFVQKTAEDAGAKLARKLDWIGRLNKKEFESDSDKSDKKGSGDESE